MTWVIPLLLFLFPLAYSPGPGNTYFAASGANLGFRRSLPAMLGYHVATFVVTLAIGLGFGLAVLADATWSRLLGLLGAAYLIYLGLRALIQATKAEPGEHEIADDAGRRGFLAGALLLLLNPKAYLIIALLFTQFGREGAGPGHILAVTTVFTLNNLVAFFVWLWLGISAARLLHTPAHRRALNTFFALALIAVGIWMAAASLLPATPDGPLPSTAAR